MKLIKQILLSFILLSTPAFAQAVPSCKPDSEMVKLLNAMIENNKLAEAIKENPKDLTTLWHKVGTEKLLEAWGILESDKTLRQNKNKIISLLVFIKSEKLTANQIENLKKSFDSQKNEEDKKKWVKLKYTKSDLETKYASMSQNPPPKLTPWTKEHKAQRWNNYKEGGGDKDYAAWSNIYDGNINKSKRADEAADNFAKTLPGKKKKEQTSEGTYSVKLTHNGRNTEVTGKRRHDILVGKHAYEIKDYRSSKVNLSADIEREVLMDVAMVDDGSVNKVTWVFTKHPDGKGRPSQPLLDLLNKHGIEVEYRNP